MQTPSTATPTILAAGTLPYTLLAAQLEGGMRRLGRVRREPRLAIDNSFSRYCGAANAADRHVRTAVWMKDRGNATELLRLPTRRGPKRVAARTPRPLHDHPRRRGEIIAAKKGLLSAEGPNDVITRRPTDDLLKLAEEVIMAVAAKRRKPHYPLPTCIPTRQPEEGILLRTKRRHKTDGAPSHMGKWRTYRAQFVGRDTCLGREVLEASTAAVIAGVRQMKTVKFTSPTCTRGELIPLLAVAAAPLGRSKLLLSKLRRSWWPGTRPLPLSRRTRAAS